MSEDQPPAGSIRNWATRDALVVAIPLLALVAGTFYLASRYIQPAPPDTLVMATGAPDGAYHQYALQYRDHLARFGVTLQLKPTQGSAENFALLRDGRVDVGFVQGGVGKPLPNVDGEPPVVSLGALYYEAMWIFQSTGLPQVDALPRLEGRRLAIGADGSGTRALALQLLQDSGVQGGATRLLSVGGANALKALDDGEIDVVFQVAGIEAPIVGDLLRRRDLKPMNLVHAGAYSKRLAHLTMITIPRGVADIAADLPDRDLTTVATTANLLARNEVHPALVYLLLDTATVVNSAHVRLSDAGTFPNPRAQDLPVAEEAQRYFRSGKPFLKQYLPFWAANFVDRMLILIIPIFGVLLPAIKFAPMLYTYRLNSRVGRWYARLGAVERDAGREPDVGREPDPARLADCVSRLDAIEREISATRLPNWMSEQKYLLRAAIDLVRERLGTPQAKAIPGLRERPGADAALGRPDGPA